MLLAGTLGTAFPSLAAESPRCDFPERRITVDGQTADWEHLAPHTGARS